MQEITIKNRDIRPIMESIMLLLRKELPVKASYGLSRTLASMEGLMKTMETLRQEILKEGAVLNEEGEFTLDKEGNVTFENVESEEAASEKVAELMDLDVEASVYSIPFSHFDTSSNEAQLEGSLLYPLIVANIITD